MVVKRSSVLFLLSAVICCWISDIQKVEALFRHGSKGHTEQTAVVSVQGDVNIHDDVTLSISTRYGVSKRHLRRVEHPIFHDDVTTFTVIGHSNGKPHLRWNNITNETREMSRQFFYDLDSDTMVSIVHTGHNRRLQVKGFLDHETRISPQEPEDISRRRSRVRRDVDDDEGRHKVWRQLENAEWRILSRLGIPLPGRHRTRGKKEGDDDDDDDDKHEMDEVHKDDYLEVPAMFRDKSLWVSPLHSAFHPNFFHHDDDNDDDDEDDDDDAYVSFDDKRRRRRRRRRKRQTLLNSFGASFSSPLNTMPSFPPRTDSTGPRPVPFNGVYVVEVMVMVDVKTYRHFNHDPALLEDYVLHFWQMVNLRLRAIVDPRLQLRIRSYGKILFPGFQLFIEDSRVNLGSKQMVDLSGVIEGFRQWMRNYETYTMHAKHDVAILMTGENLCKNMSNGTCPDSPKGIGYMGGACINARDFQMHTYDVAVAEVDRSYRGVLTATHELGHLLNASHDGEGGAMACSKSSGYIMSYTWKEATRFNQFSPCSKISISRFLTDTWYSVCLRNNTATPYSYRGHLPGFTMSLHDQCLHYNAGVPCFKSTAESQCSHLCCENILRVSLSNEPAVDGTACGPSMICFAGQCVQNQTMFAALPP